MMFRRKNKVGIFIVGAQKGGTTFLYNQLRVHPKIVGTKIEFKETNYFSQDIKYNRGEDYYHSTFFDQQLSITKRYIMESAPSYMVSPKAAQRIYEYNPKAKIIISLRDPVKRAQSQWNMFLQLRNRPKEKNEKLFKHHMEGISEARRLQMEAFMFGEKEPNLFEHLKSEKYKIDKGEDMYPGILRNGLYFEQVKRYFEVFGKENVIVLEQDDLRTNKEAKLKEVYDFLGVKNQGIAQVNSHSRSYDYSFSNDEVDFLKDYYSLPNKALFKYLDVSYNWMDKDD